jgi:hypothetical protein
VTRDVSESARSRGPAAVVAHLASRGATRSGCEEGTSVGCAGSCGGEARHGGSESMNMVVQSHGGLRSTVTVIRVSGTGSGA